MPRAARWLLITFLESVATTLIERGIYFYSHDRLGFTDAENLGLALGFGVAYACGALASHGLARRLTEKRLLVWALAAQVAGHLVLGLWPVSIMVVVLNTVLGALNGLKWPVVESYVSAGQTPARQARAVGRFNLSWSGAIPLGLAAAGPLIAWKAGSLFMAAAALNAASLVLSWPVVRRPEHLPHDHPERPTEAGLARYRALLAGSRWSMLVSYSLMWVLAALLPQVFARLDVAVTVATALSGLLDVVRGLTFLALHLWQGWHSRRWPLVVVIAGLPAGFFLALFGPDLPSVLAGEVLFGLAAGMTYYAALYYAMIVKNAAVEAGGAHEGLIGAGFALGPVAGLLGGLAAPALGGPVQGMIAGVGPLILACAAGAAWFLLRTPRRVEGPGDRAAPPGP